MKTAFGLILAALVLASCAEPAPKAPPTPAGLTPIKIIPEPLHIPPVPEPAKDSCGAWELQSLIGKPRSQVPAPVYPERRRMACTTCPVTMDFRADRLTILFDSETGVVEELKCG
jgi:hypothetical protein